MQSEQYPSAEYKIIAGIKSILGEQSSPLYPVTIGDDAAVRTENAGTSTIITTDVSVENIHFKLSYMSIEEAAYRAMIANISDCAAMGAVPESAVIQLVTPSDTPDIERDIEAVYRGFARACHTWKFVIIGGDLSRGHEWIIGITMIGHMEGGCTPLLRTGIQPGDKVYISGIPGRSAAGLFILQHYGRDAIPAQYQSLVHAHIHPTPRVTLGLYLAKNPYVHAVMDCSDGLSKDCRTLCHENGIGMFLSAKSSQLPKEMVKLSREHNMSPERWLYHGGEDYELIFTTSKQFDPNQCPECVPMCIGECTNRYLIPMIENGAEVIPLYPESYDHFT